MKGLLTFTALLLCSFANAQLSEGQSKINGTNLYTVVMGTGETLIVLHGGPGLSHDYFRPFLDPLAEKLRLVYYDQRACGRSDTPSPDSISIPFFIDDIESLRESLGVEKVNLLAHSWADVLAIRYALSYPDHVGKIILSNPAMLSREYDQETMAFIKAKTTPQDSLVRNSILASGQMDVKKYEQLFQLSFKISAYDRKNMDKLNLNLPDNFAEANTALFTGLSRVQGAVNYYDSLGGIHAPVLILHGRADGIPWNSIERLKAGISGSTVKVLEKSGHFPFIEQPEEYIQSVLQFLQPAETNKLVKKRRN